MLYRAHVHTVGDAPVSAEMTVFFEVPPGADAFTRLVDIVSRAWCCPAESLDAYNMLSERDLRTWYGPELVVRDADYDTHLLQTGDGPDGPQYSQPDRTQCFVTPRWQQRLAHARQRVDAHLHRRRLEALQRLHTVPPGAWPFGQPASRGPVNLSAGA